MKNAVRYIYPILYILGDTAGVFLGFYLAYEIRFFSAATRVFPITKGVPELGLYLYATIFVCAVWIFIFGIMGHYKRRPPSSFDRFYEVFRGVSAGSLIIIASTFFFRGESFSRLVMGFGWVIDILLIFAIREIIYRFELSLLRKGFGAKRAVFLGSEKGGLDLYEKLAKQPAWGIEPIGFLSDSNSGYPILGRIDQIDEITKKYRADMIIFSLPAEKRDLIANIVISNENLNVEYMMTPDIMGMFTSRSTSGQIEGIPVLRWGRTPIEGYSRIVKRLFDLLFSGLVIIALSPLMLIIAILIKFDSKGPVLFKQHRIGRNGREFMMLKFRSMKFEKENTNSTGWTVENDPRRTRAGRFIRRYSLDELPQLFNAFAGHMSIVGPRPEQPDYVRQFKDDIPQYFQRHKVKSGITGWAQVNGLRGDTSIRERTRYDLYYVENWSLILDIKIILLTIRSIFKSDGAY
ncbi:MAG: undecaprenyl-phosphate glucose phosphotransferase [Candidatus Zixiibacteriota bacterium]|nr:MAG: undecaprenyl-phosphate glucose phosphotransferase [candidate division Zixibacteria bacterium]